MASLLHLPRYTRYLLSLCILLTLTISAPLAHADTIVFQNPNGQQNGTVVSEDNTAVTIRFPKTAIKSITKTPGKEPIPQNADQVILEEKDGYRILKIPNHLFTIRSSGSRKNQSEMRENTVESRPNAKQSLSTSATGEQSHSIQSKLVEEEMGQAQGTILWHGQPLQGTVKIVMSSYTGFSLAALKKIFSSDPNATTDGTGIILSAQTDTQGHYFFAKVPPGSYRLYWEPTDESGYYHRLRDKPDFVVVAGKITTQDIPGK